MDEGPETRSGERPSSSGRSRREAVVVALGMAVVVVVALASVAAASVRLSSGTTAPGPILFWGEARGADGLYQGGFSLGPPSRPNGTVGIDAVVQVNVTCGGPSSMLLGAEYNCSASLVRGPLGGPSEDLAWFEWFTGDSVSTVLAVPPGAYTLFVHVSAGAPPLAAVIAPFDVAVEVSGTD
jgi:hypothetical protein